MPSLLAHFLSSGLLGLFVFSLTWTVYGKYLAWRHPSNLRWHLGETFTRRFYLSFLPALLASLSLHLHLDRESFGGFWVYLLQELNGYPHPFGNQLVVIIVITLCLSGFIVKMIEKEV
jgi:hypothetical protein